MPSNAISPVCPVPKSVENAQAAVPYHCPHCFLPATNIKVAVRDGLAVFWHQECTNILNVQLVEAPAPPQPRIVQPARVLRH